MATCYCGSKQLQYTGQLFFRHKIFNPIQHSPFRYYEVYILKQGLAVDCGTDGNWQDTSRNASYYSPDLGSHQTGVIK